jgi:class 3 adenylate cyclase/tetratricopeptide (TPR) repeat protein
MTATGDQITNLRKAIAALESQRDELGDAVVDSGLASMRKQLAEMQGKSELPQQQRKLATILFLDVVGSTRLGQHLEPDEVLESMDAALKHLAAPVEAHGGHVTRFQGDGFKAVFGVPVAHENDPEQAVRAGLEILETAKQIAGVWEEQLGISGFQVRVGINTGLVASGGETEADDTIMGRAVNLAARLESAAPPGYLLISHHTYRHVRGVFNVEPHEPLQAKGFDRPVEVYLVRSAKPRAFHVLTRGVEGVETRMVGRETELKYLQDALLTAIEEGEGQLVTVVGEAGVGKSRLIYEFQNWLEFLPQGVRLYTGQAKLETQHIPYSLLRDLLAYRFQIQDSDPLEVVRQKFEQGVTPAILNQPASLEREELSSQAQVHLLGQLLGFDFSHSPHLKGFLYDAEALRNRGQLALETYVSTLSKSGTVVLFLEDVHWADESSLDAIRRLGKLTSELPLLIVCLTRGILYERRPYWGEGETYHRKLSLEPLSKRESRQLVEEILQHVDQVPLELRELVVSGAEGNPFYLEELLKMLIEQGVILTGEFDVHGVERWRVATEKLAQIDLPSTLAGVLQARMDSLTVTEKKILQQAAVVGRTFWDQLLAHLYSQVNAKQGGIELAEVLKVLREKELIFRREESSLTGAVEYTFKHDLLREVVYETVLVKERKHYHGLVADWLMENSGERLREVFGLSAEHLEKAGRNQQAVETYLLAGDRALEMYSNREAQGYYQSAFKLADDDGMKARAITDLGRALARQGSLNEALEGWEEGISLYQTQKNYEGMAELHTLAMRWSLPHHPTQAMQICRASLPLLERLEDSSILANLLHQVGRTHLFNEEEDKALHYCQQALVMGERLGDVKVQADTQATMATLRDQPIDWKLKWVRRAIELAETHHLLYILGRALNNLILILNYYTGNLKDTLRYHHRAVEVTRLRGDSGQELFALNQLAYSHLFLGNLKEVKDIFNQIDAKLKLVPELDAIKVMMNWRMTRYLRQKGEWSSAQKTMLEAIEGYQNLGIKHEWSFYVLEEYMPTMLEMDRFLGQTNWSHASRIMQELIELPEKEIESKQQHGSIYGFMSILCSRLGELDQAKHWLHKGINLSAHSNLFLDRKDLLLAKIELAYARKDWSQAIDRCEDYLNLVASLGFRWEMARTYLEMGDIYACRNEPDDLVNARHKYQQSLDLFSEMGSGGYVQVLIARIDNLPP